MSLIAQALCITAQNMVKGQTWAADDVLLQPVYPIEQVMEEGREARPVIAVYAESSKFDGFGRGSQGVKAVVEIKFIVYNSPGLNRFSIDGVETLEITVDTETAGLTLNVVARQIDSALRKNTPLWADCWRKMVVNIKDRDVRYILIEIENGVKIPAVEIGYTVESIPDPDVVEELYGAWALFDTALRSTDEGVLVAELFKSLIVASAEIPDWQRFRDNFALTPAGLQATGVGPYRGVTLLSGEVPPLTGHTVTGSSGPINE